eukprot:jgi/Botrbrau1/15216/Bobra.0149s0071.1
MEKESATSATTGPSSFECKHLLALPNDVKLRVFENVDISVIRKLKLVSKEVNGIANACISRLVLDDPCGTTTKPQLEAMLQSSTGLTSLDIRIHTKDQLLLLDANGAMRVLTGVAVNVASLSICECNTIKTHLEKASNLQSLSLSSDDKPLALGLGLLLSVCSGLRRLSVVNAELRAREAAAVLTATHLTALNVQFSDDWRWWWEGSVTGWRGRAFWDVLGAGLSQLTALVELGLVPHAQGLVFLSQLTGLQALRIIVWTEEQEVVNALLAMPRIGDLDISYQVMVVPDLYVLLMQSLAGLTRLRLPLSVGAGHDLWPWPPLLPHGLQELEIHFGTSMSRRLELFPNMKLLQNLEVRSMECFPNLVRCIGPLTGLTHLGISGASCLEYRGGGLCPRCTPLGLNWQELSCLLHMSGLCSLKLEVPVLFHEQNLRHLQGLSGLTRVEAWGRKELSHRTVRRLGHQVVETLGGIEQVILGKVPIAYRYLLDSKRRALGLNPCLWC